VGNQTAGDVATEVDYLDTGNGAQLAAAITAAGVGTARDVWIRPGTYNLDLVGAPVGPITVPSNIMVRGAGRSLTRIETKDAGDGRAFILNSGSTISDLYVNISRPDPAGGGVTGVSLITLAVNATCQNVSVLAEQGNLWNAADVALTQLRRIFDISSNAGSAKLINCKTPYGGVTSIPVFQPAADLYMVYLQANTSSPQINDCFFYGADICIHSSNLGGFSASRNSIFTKRNFVLNNGSESTLIEGNDCHCLGIANGTERSVEVTGAGHPRLSVVNNRFEAGTPTVAPSVCISLVAVNGAVVTGNSIINFDTGVTLDAVTAFTVVTGNMLRGITPLQHIIDLGSTNEVAHNILG
jgi:hypothetical protein